MQAERTPHADDSLLAQPLLAVTQWSLRAPSAVLTGAVLLALLSIAVAVNGLTFKTSRLDLLNPRSDYNRRWLAYLHEFGDRDDAVVVVRADERRALTAAIDDMAARIRAEPQLFESVFHRRDLSALKRKTLHFMPTEELERLERQLREALGGGHLAGEAPSDPLAQLASLNDQLAHIGVASPEQRAHVEAQYARSAGLLLAALAGNGPAAATIADERPKRLPAVQQLAFTSQAPSNAPLLAQFEPQYLLADEGRLGFVLLKFAKQEGTSPHEKAIARLRQLIAETRPAHPDAWIGLTGMPVIEFDEMQASQEDMLWTSMVSLTLVIGLYLAAYGGLRHAALLNCVLLLATAYSFGFVTLVVGHLNILSSAFSAVLIGVGIDFGIHYLASYLKLRQDGCGEEQALLQTAVDVGPGMVTGGVTTAAAFFMAAMTDFVGVRELGLVAGGSILLCVASAVVILPPLVLVVDRRWPMRKSPTILPAGRWAHWPLRWPRLMLAAAAVMTVVLGLGTFRLRYDHNLLNLQPRHLESADIERQLLTQMDDSVWFAVSLCPTREELRRRKAAFERLSMVAKTEEIASLLPDRNEDDSRRIAGLSRLLAGSPGPPAAPGSLDVGRLRQEVARAEQLLARETPYETTASIQLAALSTSLDRMPPAEAVARLAQGYAGAMAQSAGPMAALREMADPLPPKLSDLPPELVDRFVGASGCYLLRVYAHGNIWNMRELETFVREVETIDPRTTGHPVQTYYASRHMQQSYLWAGLYALVAVFLFLLTDFRSLRHTLLAMVPLGLGFVQLCGLIGWLGLPFNAANMIVLPLILGIGVDHGVHLVHLYRQQRGRFVLGDATAMAVVLTAMTTTASFGALILARHQGLQSLGQVLTLGAMTCLVSSIGFFPALLCWITRHRPAGGAVAELPVEQESGRESLAEDDSRIVNDSFRQSLPNPSAPATDAAPFEPVVAAPLVLAEPANELPPEPTDLPTVPESLVAEPVPLPLTETPPLPLASVPVTDEEIAALLESAFVPARIRLPTLSTDEPAAEGPRRRNLPRRSDAA